MQYLGPYCVILPFQSVGFRFQLGHSVTLRMPFGFFRRSSSLSARFTLVPTRSPPPPPRRAELENGCVGEQGVTHRGIKEGRQKEGEAVGENGVWKNFDARRESRRSCARPDRDFFKHFEVFKAPQPKKSAWKRGEISAGEFFPKLLHISSTARQSWKWRMAHGCS